MKKLNILLFFLLFTSFFSISYAENLSCQYQDYVYETKEVIVFYEFGIKLNYSLLEIAEFYQARITVLQPAQFRVYNYYTHPIEADVFFIKNGKLDNQSITIDSGGYVQVSRTVLDYIDQKSIYFVIRNNEFLESRKENVDFIVETFCKQCLGNICLNDGQSCASPQECGSGFCVEGYCSDSEYCYNNNCKCNLDEIQCDDNKKCVKIGVIPIDIRPECGKYKECVTEYINPDTGLCAKSPTQIQEEEDKKLKEELEYQEIIQKEEHQRLMDELAQKEKERKFMIYAIIGLIFLVLLSACSIFYLKNKHEKEKQRTIEIMTDSDIRLEEAKQKTYEKEITLLRKRQDAIFRKKKELKQLKKISFLNKKEKEKIRRLKHDINKKTYVMKEEVKKNFQVFMKPHPSIYANGRLVIKNPYLGGYECFYEKGLDPEKYPYSKMIHRWVWKKAHGMNPRHGYHIHHKDGNKYNNNINNLEEVYGQEHYSRHRNNTL